MTQSHAIPIDQTAVDDGRIARMMITTIERDLETERCGLVLGPYEVGKSYVACAIAHRLGLDAIVLDGTDPCHRPALNGTSTVLRVPAASSSSSTRYMERPRRSITSP